MALYKPIDYVIAIVILIALLYIAKHLFKVIEIDRNFAIAMLPVMLFGIFLRVMVDAGFFEKNKIWNVTPGIYILSFTFGLGLILLGLALQERYGIKYYKVVMAIAFPISLFLAFKLYQNMLHPIRMLYPISLAAFLTALTYLLSLCGIKQIEFIQRKENLLIIFSQMLDGSGTFIGINYYGFGEEHILTEHLINLVGSAAIIIPIKLCVILLVLYLMEKWEEDEREIKIIKFVLFILGFGPGLRNSLVITLAV